MDLGWVKTAADFYRLTAEQIAEQPGFGEVSADKLVDAIEASKQQPFGRVAVRARDRGGRLRHRPQPRPAVPHDRRAADRARPRRSSRRQGVGPKMAQDDPRPACRRADAGADRGPESSRACASRRKGPPPGEGPLAGQDVRAHRHAPRPDPRAGHRDDHRRRRQGDRLGLHARPTTWSPARARGRSSPRPSGSGSRCSTRPGCVRC